MNDNKHQLRRDLLILSWPAAVELTLASMHSMITMAMVSSLGKEVVSAVGITNQPIMVPQVLTQAFAVGGTALVARALGQDDIKTARRVSEQSMFLAIIFSIILGFVMYAFGGPFIKIR